MLHVATVFAHHGLKYDACIPVSLYNATSMQCGCISVHLYTPQFVWVHLSPHAF